jgi:uncharacterized CHY-type Zn-finger protein
MANKGKLDALPSSKDKFWKHAEVNTHKMDKQPTCKHFFEQKGSTRIECKGCNAGFICLAGEYAKDGHMYTRTGELMI